MTNAIRSSTFYGEEQQRQFSKKKQVDVLSNCSWLLPDLGRIDSLITCLTIAFRSPYPPYLFSKRPPWSSRHVSTCTHTIPKDCESSREQQQKKNVLFYPVNSLLREEEAWKNKPSSSTTTKMVIHSLTERRKNCSCRVWFFLLLVTFVADCYSVQSAGHRSAVPVSLGTKSE